MRKEDGRRFTSYYAACKLIGNMILCNEIEEVFPPVQENLRFSLELDNGEYRTVYQWYITDCDDNDVRMLEQTFSDMLFAWCEELGKWILCVDHFGTPWQSVEVEVLDPDFPDKTILNLEA